MNEGMLIDIVVKIIENWKKYVGCVVGFVIGVTIVKYGFINALFIILLAFLGYKLGDGVFTKRLKKRIINKLKDD